MFKGCCPIHAGLGLLLAGSEQVEFQSRNHTGSVDTDHSELIAPRQAELYTYEVSDSLVREEFVKEGKEESR